MYCFRDIISYFSKVKAVTWPSGVLYGTCASARQYHHVKAKFDYAIWSHTGSKLVADLQRAEIWPIIQLASSELAQATRSATGPRPASDRPPTSFDQVRAISTCRDSSKSNLLEPGRRPIRSQIPLRYLVADRSEAGRRPVTDLLARASSLLAS